MITIMFGRVTQLSGNLYRDCPLFAVARPGIFQLVDFFNSMDFRKTLRISGFIVHISKNHVL